MDLIYSLWWAALELVRASDNMRELTACGRVTRPDVDRIHAADERWTQVRAECGR